MFRFSWLLALAVLLPGCVDDTVSPRDVTPPAAPRGVYSITGDGKVFVSWLANSESDLVGYKVYIASCAGGSGCPYDLVSATTGTTLTVGSLANGQTRYFAVAAYDRAGNESALSYETIHDTPRPEGFGLVLANSALLPDVSGYDFSVDAVRAFDDPRTDIYFGVADSRYVMFAPFTDTEVQDAGFASSLDAVDYAPLDGWAQSGTVELTPGHCYVVLTTDSGQDHYAKFRVNAVSVNGVSIDWAYQVSPNNRELQARPATPPDRIRREFRARS